MSYCELQGLTPFLVLPAKSFFVSWSVLSLPSLKAKFREREQHLGLQGSWLNAQQGSCTFCPLLWFRNRIQKDSARLQYLLFQGNNLCAYLLVAFILVVKKREEETADFWEVKNCFCRSFFLLTCHPLWGLLGMSPSHFFGVSRNPDQQFSHLNSQPFYSPCLPIESFVQW